MGGRIIPHAARSLALPGLLLCALVPGLVLAQSSTESTEPEREPLDIGFREETGVRRLFIDVECKDGDGNPMVGLTKDDFKIRLNYLYRKIYTVDDFCPCAPGLGDQGVEAPTPVTTAEVEPRTPRSEAGFSLTLDEDAIRRAEIETRYVLYFDFSQLAPAGREEALEYAETWVGTMMEQGDEAMVVAYSSEAGLHQLTGFTTDPEALLAAIERARSEERFDDPFPGDFWKRLDMCGSGTVGCYYSARKDYFQIRRSLRALLGFVTRMEEVRGRKALLLFHQNMAMFPGRLYADPGDSMDALGSYMVDGGESDDVPDLIEMTGEVGAAATMARVELHVLNVGASSDWTINLGANFADFTGGSYNRDLTQVAETLAFAGRGCRCIYRIGVEPPGEGSQVYKVKVKAKGKSLKHRWLVHYLTEKDRWKRRAAAVLTNPADDWTIDIGAAMIPRREGRQRWGVTVQVALDLKDLALSDTEDRRYEWEVGGLLARHGEVRTKKVWEMLGVSRTVKTAVKNGETLVLHERTFPDLKPGEYEFRAFVRDRNSDAFGGAQVKLVLAGPKEGGLVGPVVLRRQGVHRVAPLPLQGGLEYVEVARAKTVGEGWVPLGLRPPRSGEALLFRGFVCADKDSSGTAIGRRYVAAGGRTFHEFGKGGFAPGGSCSEVEDRFETVELFEGGYEYRLDHADATEGEVVPVILPFEVGGGS
jgi:hypothetical protein